MACEFACCLVCVWRAWVLVWGGVSVCDGGVMVVLWWCVLVVCFGGMFGGVFWWCTDKNILY
jgi:hypothetical protein